MQSATPERICDIQPDGELTLVVQDSRHGGPGLLLDAAGEKQERACASLSDTVKRDFVAQGEGAQVPVAARVQDHDGGSGILHIGDPGWAWAGNGALPT